MRIGGFQRLTLVDYPGKVAATVFTQGCNFRCGFCHNAALVLPEAFQVPIPEQEVLEFCRQRRGQLQGIVISGGEPTIQKGLVDFIASLKDMGYVVKLDTNGSHPEVVAALIDQKLIDYIAMDVKTSLARYAEVVRCGCDIAKIQQSIDLILKCGLPYQFRTTLVDSVCSINDLLSIQDMLHDSNNYVLQPFVPSSTMVDPLFQK